MSPVLEVDAYLFRPHPWFPDAQPVYARAESDPVINYLARIARQIIHQPLQAHEPLTAVKAALPTGKTLLLSSPLAVQALTLTPGWKTLRSMPLYAIGSKTAQAARSAGFTVQPPMFADSRQLITWLAEQANHTDWLYISAEETAADLVSAFATVGLPLTHIPLYRTVPLNFSAPEIKINLGKISFLLFYSSRNAATFRALQSDLRPSKPHPSPCHAGEGGLAPIKAKTFLFCLSQRIADVLTEPMVGAPSAWSTKGAPTLLGPQFDVRVAPQPDAAGMVKILTSAVYDLQHGNVT